MSTIPEPIFLAELKRAVSVPAVIKTEPIGQGYYFLQQYAKQIIIPLLIQKNATLAIVELTTCGLISDLLTSQSGASDYFLLGITPYNTDMKVKFGISQESLKHDGPGTVSLQTAKALANKVRLYSNAIIGLAETGLLPSNLESRRTQKEAGECYFAISTAVETVSQELEIQKDLPRLLMRQNIAWEILKEFERFLNNHYLL